MTKVFVNVNEYFRRADVGGIVGWPVERTWLSKALNFGYNPDARSLAPQSMLANNDGMK